MWFERAAGCTAGARVQNDPRTKVENAPVVMAANMRRVPVIATRSAKLFVIKFAPVGVAPGGD